MFDDAVTTLLDALALLAIAAGVGLMVLGQVRWGLAAAAAGVTLYALTLALGKVAAVIAGSSVEAGDGA